MDHTAAVTALIAKLRAIGYADDEFKCEYSKDEIKVTILRVPNSYTKLEILITDMWAYPNESCYFVNFSNSANGNFSAGAGTPSIDTAIFDLGQAVWFAQSSDYKKPRRVLELPEGVTNIFVETGRENMIGDILVVQTAKGAEIRLNAVELGEHEVGVMVSYDGHESGSFINADPKKPNQVGHF